jgi:hypothetical protein
MPRGSRGTILPAEVGQTDSSNRLSQRSSQQNRDTPVAGECGETIIDHMIWFFRRGHQALQLETRFDNASKEYVIVTMWADRPAVTERFHDFAQFRTRVFALEQELDAAQWKQAASPTIIPDGWRGP